MKTLTSLHHKVPTLFSEAFISSLGCPTVTKAVGKVYTWCMYHLTVCRYEQDLDVYKSRVSQTVKMCKEKLYDPPVCDDPHAIRYDSAVMNRSQYAEYAAGAL